MTAAPSLTATSDWRISYGMRQSLLFRLAGALLVPLYTTGAWIAPALQVCPMHGSPAAAHVMAQMHAPATHAPESDEQASDASVSSAQSMAGHVMPAARVAATVAAAQTASLLPMVMVHAAPSGEHAHGCDCIGCCASSNGPAVPAITLAVVAPLEQNAVHFEIQNAGAVITRIAHVLPFSTAPPNTLV